MPTHLPRAAPGNFLQVRGEAERKAGGSLHHHRPQHPTRARAAQASVGLSVRPPPAAPGAGRRGGLTLGPLFGTASPSLPAARAPRRPPAVRSAAIPSPGPPSRRSPAASSEPGRGRASPSGAARQPFPGCPRRAERSERGWDRRQRDPPLSGDRSSHGENEPRGAGPKPASARLLASSLSAWAAGAAGSEAARRLRRPGLPTPSPGRRRRRPAGKQRGAGAPSPGPDARRSSPPPPPRPAPNLYLRNPSPARGPLRLCLRGSAPSPAPPAPHPGRVDLTPRAQRGKVWE